MTTREFAVIREHFRGTLTSAEHEGRQADCLWVMTIVSGLLSMRN